MKYLGVIVGCLIIICSLFYSTSASGVDYSVSESSTIVVRGEINNPIVTEKNPKFPNIVAKKVAINRDVVFKESSNNKMTGTLPRLGGKRGVNLFLVGFVVFILFIVLKSFKEFRRGRRN